CEGALARPRTARYRVIARTGPPIRRVDDELVGSSVVEGMGPRDDLCCRGTHDDVGLRGPVSESPCDRDRVALGVRHGEVERNRVRNIFERDPTRPVELAELELNCGEV